MSAPLLPADPAPTFQPTDVLQTLLAMAPIGIVLMRPHYAENDAARIADFTFVQLNPAARQMLGGLPERPAGSLLTLFPSEHEVGGFAFYCAAFRSGQVERYQQLYQADGYDGYYQVVAQRHDDLLLVTFTDTNDQDRSAVEVALRESQARERAALAEAEAQRQLLTHTLEQLPVAVAVHEGPAHVLTYYNSRYQELAARPLALGQPAAALFPELVGQAFFQVPDQVYATGEPVMLVEAPAQLRHPATGDVSQHYFTTRYDPRRDTEGRTTGLLVTAIPVTEQVLARQQVEQLNAEMEAARAKAERERTLLQALLTQAPVAIALFKGEELRVAEANAQMAAIWGSTPAQVLGRPLLEGVPELQGQGFDDLLRQVLRTQVPVTGTETPAVLLRGEETQTSYYNFVYQPLYDAEGQVLGIIDVAVEVTEQVLARRQVEQLNAELAASNAEYAQLNADLQQTQHQLEQLNQELEARVRRRTQELAGQRQQLRQILAQLPAAVAALEGPKHRVAFANRLYHTLVSTPGAVGPDFFDLLDRVHATGEPYRGRSIPVQLPDAATGLLQTHYLDFSYQPLRDEQGGITSILAFAVDETEKVLARRQADTLQAALLAVAQRQAQERQNVYQLFEQLPAAIVLLREPDHRIEYHNPAFVELFPPGPLLGALQGRPLASVYPQAELARLLTLLDQVYCTGESQVVTEMPLTALQAGNVRYVTFVYQAYREQGRVTGVAAFMYDVTEQVLTRQQVLELNQELASLNHTLQQTNAELHQSNAHLTRTNVDLDTFVYTASHDLKAPITNIEGLLTALHQVLPSEVQDEETTAHILRLLQGSVERFQLTIEQLTDISRLQQAQHQPAEQVPLAPVAADVHLDLLPQLTAAGAQLMVDIVPTTRVLFAPKNLRSVVYNLLSNAVKYRSPDRVPVITLHAAQVPGAVLLTVQDNGLGMTTHQQRRLFGLFQRLHTHVEGIGVGLYIVKRMVENAGGTITVQSQEGVGTTFVVTFPA